MSSSYLTSLLRNENNRKEIENNNKSNKNTNLQIFIPSINQFIHFILLFLYIIYLLENIWEIDVHYQTTISRGNSPALKIN